MGVLGYTIENLLDLTPKQFFCALQGKYDYDGQQLEAGRNVLYSAIRFNASSISAGLSGDLSKEINRISFDWEKESKKKKGITYGELIDQFDAKLN